MDVTQAYAKDISNLQAIVNWAADMQLHGSFSDRRPDLGRMFRCSSCGKRRRANGPRCCNPTFATTQRAWDPEQGFHQIECAERSNAQPFSKAFVKRMIHQSTKRHGQNKNFKIRHQSFLFQTYPHLLAEAVKAMHLYKHTEIGEVVLDIPKSEHVPAFAERYWRWAQERQDKATHKRVRISRQINRRIA